MPLLLQLYDQARADPTGSNALHRHFETIVTLPHAKSPRPLRNTRQRHLELAADPSIRQFANDIALVVDVAQTLAFRERSHRQVRTFEYRKAGTILLCNLEVHRAF